jgi:hypothetical protein
VKDVVETLIFEMMLGMADVVGKVLKWTLMNGNCRDREVT